MRVIIRVLARSLGLKAKHHTEYSSCKLFGISTVGVNIDHCTWSHSQLDRCRELVQILQALATFMGFEPYASAFLRPQPRRGRHIQHTWQIQGIFQVHLLEHLL